jgi:hypothetical protein
MARVATEQPRGGGQPMPQAVQWMPSPWAAHPPSNMPLGLSYLAQLTTLIAQQEPSVTQSISNTLFWSICFYMVFE